MAAIVQYWHSEEIPEEVAVLLAGFRERNRDMRHLLFDETSAARFIAERFGPREAAAFGACAVPAMQADYLRYCAVLHYGGVYADADMRCVAPLSSLLETCGAGILFGWPRLPRPWQTPYFEGRESVGPFRVVFNGLFAFPAAGHPLLELAVEVATANIEHRVAEEVGATTGPIVFSCLYVLHRLGSFERFAEYAEGTVYEAPAALMPEAIGDFARVERAFDGVRISPVEEGSAWARPVRPPLAYKEAEHWTTVTSSIYR